MAPTQVDSSEKSEILGFRLIVITGVDTLVAIPFIPHPGTKKVPHAK